MAEGLWQKAGNGLMFNISWLAIVGGESLWIALPVAITHLVVHMLWLGQGRRELLFIGGIALFGLALDNFLFAIGVFTLAGASAAAPLWLSCLWPVLATTLGHAFAVLQRNLPLAAVAGAAGGFMSYAAGTAMSAVGYGDPVYGPIIITALWAALFPALALAARWALTETRGEASLV